MTMQDKISGKIMLTNPNITRTKVIMNLTRIIFQDKAGVKIEEEAKIEDFRMIDNRT